MSPKGDPQVIKLKGSLTLPPCTVDVSQWYNSLSYKEIRPLHRRQEGRLQKVDREKVKCQNIDVPKYTVMVRV